MSLLYVCVSPVSRLPVYGVGHDRGHADAANVGDHVVRVGLPVDRVAPGDDPVLGPQARPPSLPLRSQASPDSLTDPLRVVAQEPLDGLQSHLAVSCGEELVSEHLTNKQKLYNQSTISRTKGLFQLFTANFSVIFS